jgi:hypothetical protein
MIEYPVGWMNGGWTFDPVFKNMFRGVKAKHNGTVSQDTIEEILHTYNGRYVSARNVDEKDVIVFQDQASFLMWKLAWG